MKFVTLVTTRFGGPYQWGKRFAHWLNHEEDEWYCIQYNRGQDIIRQPFLLDCDLMHTIIAYPMRLWRQPTLLDIRGDFRKERAIWRMLYPMAMRYADRIRVPSYYLKNTLNLRGAVVIPNAIDPIRLPPKKSTESLTIVTVTSFWFREKAYGVGKIAQALQKIKKPHQDIRWLIAGSGPYLSTAQTLAFSHFPEAEFLGHQSTQSVLAKADIFCYWSGLDNMPNAVLEAMAAGLAVVTNNVGAIPEMIDPGENGYIAESFDHYCQMLGELLSTQSMRTGLGLAAQHKIESTFSWQIIGPRLIKLYHSMM